MCLRAVEMCDKVENVNTQNDYETTVTAGTSPENLIFLYQLILYISNR